MGKESSLDQENHAPKRQTQRFKRQAARTEKADWSKASADLIHACICAVTRQGGALRFGYTSDGGAYAVGVYGDGAPFTDYLKPGEDVDAYLEDMLRAYQTE